MPAAQWRAPLAQMRPAKSRGGRCVLGTANPHRPAARSRNDAAGRAYLSYLVDYGQQHYLYGSYCSFLIFVLAHL